MNRQISNLVRRYPFIIRLPYLVYRRLQTRYTIGAVGVIFNSLGQVLIVEHVFHPHHPWGLPGGWVGYDEEPAFAVVRELEEELQLQATVKGVIHIEKRFKNHLDIAYMCEISNEVGHLSDELLDYRWVYPKDLPSMNSFHLSVIDKAIQHFPRG